MYKISDFTEEAARRVKSFIDNHLFLLFFFVFVLLVGTFGIWVKPVIIDDNFIEENFINSFNTISLISYSMPLLSVLAFDKIVTTIRKITSDPENLDTALLVWFSIIFLVFMIIIGILYAIGAKAGNLFSWYSFSAWVLGLFIWIMGNVDNEAYQNPGNPNNSTGGDDVDRSKLRRGN